MIYRIEKNTHYSKPHKLKLLLNTKKISYSVKFLLSCEYDLNNLDQGDMNKLFGIGYLPTHHKHSARFGWRWDLQKKKVEICAYIYDGGQRTIISLGWCTLGVKYTFDLMILQHTYLFGIQGDDIYVTETYPLKHIPFKTIGYLLHPYFGGNQLAPHEIHIELTSL